MIARTKLLALFSVGVSTFALLAMPADAAPTRTFTPATSWAVSRIEPANGGAPYCTLARRFDGNTVITFARNTTGEGTVAVDFQQPLFDPNQTYRIGLQAGNGLIRHFMTRPATPNAIVLRTGEDAKFFNALNTASELGVILDNVRYAFTIPDFSAGTGQLTGCIGDAPAVASPRTPVIASAPSASVESGALGELRAQLDALKAENAGIVASLKKQEAGTSAQVSTSLPATAENKELTQRLAALESEKNALVDRLQTERSRQQQEAQDERAMKQALEDQKALKSMLESERSARAALEASLQEKTADAEKRGELRARIAALETSNAELKTLRETLETERSKRLAAEKMLQDQRAASAASLEDQERLRTRVTELENQNKSLQLTAGQVNDMKAQLEDTGTRASMEQARREAAEKALQQMQVSSSERAMRLENLEKQLEQERAKMADAQAASAKELTQRHADEIARLNLETEKLREQQSAELTKLREQQAVAEDLKSRAVTEQARREAAEKALKEMQLSASENAARLKKVEDERNAQISILQQQLGVERKKMDAAQTAKASEMAEKHAAEMERLNRELSSLRAANATSEDMKARVDAEQARLAATERELNEARKQLSEKSGELTRLSAEKSELLARVETEREQAANARVAQQDSAKLKEMSARLAEMESRNSGLMAQLHDAKNLSEAAEKAAVTTASNDAQTNERIVEMGRKAEADRRELKTLLETETARRKKLESIMAGGSDSDRLKEMNAQMAELATRNADLERRLQDEQARLAPASGGDNGAEISALRKQLDVLKGDNQMLAEKLSASAAAPAPASGGKDARVVFAGDEDMASELAESKSSLASVMAERDEYRGLLQRERMVQKEGGRKANTPADPGANARIAELEAERVELVRKLEFERARSGQIASGREAPPASGNNEGELNERLAQVEAEKARLKKQLDVAQQDVIDARRKALAGSGTPDADVAALLNENRKLQSELAASAAGGGGRDVRALETEIAALRAQNNVLSEEINKRLAAAPTRAAMDNAAAEANYKVKSAKTSAQKEVAADMVAAQTRYDAAESENIRLARELAQARNELRVASVKPAHVSPVVAPIVSSTEAMATVAPVMAAPVVAPVAQPVVAQPVMAKAPVPAPVRTSSMFTPASIPAALPQQQAGPTGKDIQDYLKRAGVPMVSGFEKVAKVSGPQFGAFRWDTGTVFGTAEQQATAAMGGNFEQSVNAYLQKTKGRCSGTFDQSFDAAQVLQNKNFAVADVACVMPDGTGAGAAMLFYTKDGVFNAIAHEGDISQFDQAMGTRDNLARFLKGII